MPFTDPELESVRLVEVADITGLSKLRARTYTTSATAAPATIPSFLSKKHAPVIIIYIKI
jgi:hypothetical protein